VVTPVYQRCVDIWGFRFPSRASRVGLLHRPPDLLHPGRVTRMDSLRGRDGHEPRGAGGSGQPLVVTDELVDVADLKRGLQVDRVEGA